MGLPSATDTIIYQGKSMTFGKTVCKILHEANQKTIERDEKAETLTDVKPNLVKDKFGDFI